MKVRDIMTEPVATCTPQTSLAVAAGRMRDMDYGTLAVVDTAGRLVGIITDRDVCLALAGTRRSAANMAVHETMTPKVVAVFADDDVHDALAAMKRHRVRRVPVRDASGFLEGMLSIEDVVLRGLEKNGIETRELVDALRAMYVRVPVAVEVAPGSNEYTPG